MNKVVKKGLCGIALCLFAMACRQGGIDVDSDRVPIVSVGEYTLYKGELDEMMPLNYLKADSASIADRYVRSWIDDILIYDKARKNISDQQRIEDMVSDYRKTLTIHSYQEDILSTMEIDAMSELKLREFYEKNKEVLRLEVPIIKGLYLKVPIESPEVNNFKKWYSTGKDKEIANIEKNALQHAIGYELFYNRWVDFNDMLSVMPINVENKDDFLKHNSKVNISDSLFVYLLHISEYKLKGDVAPFEYVENDIKKAIVELERNQFLKKVEQDLFDKAMSDKTIKFYNK